MVQRVYCGSWDNSRQDGQSVGRTNKPQIPTAKDKLAKQKLMLTSSHKLSQRNHLARQTLKAGMGEGEEAETLAGGQYAEGHLYYLFLK